MTDSPKLTWQGRWVAYGSTPSDDLGVFALRCPLKLASKPDQLLVHVSADQRYKLFVNEQQVAFGPQRGDLNHWFYETVDLAPYLKEGENVVWALFWYFGWLAPMAQITYRAGFLCDSDLPELCTPGNWQIARVPGWEFGQYSKTALGFVGPDEKIDGRLVADWRTLPHNESIEWKVPCRVRTASTRGDVFEPYWALVPRTIPPMMYDLRSEKPAIRRGFAGDSTTDFPGVADRTELTANLTMNPGSHLLLDYNELLCAYPRVVLQGKPGTVVTLTYAEGLWMPDDQGKGNRNEVVGKQMQGMQDLITLGDDPVVFEPLWWRTYRYLMIEVDDSSPVTLKAIDAVDTGYPYEVQSSFEADDPWIKPVWDTSLRTAFRCAGETYFDCPFYEQLQYVGDTRIQAMIHYYLSTDRALPRNSIEQFGWSMMDNDLTQSRYPNRTTQTIPPFSLWWVMMLWDQMLYDDFDAAQSSVVEARSHPDTIVKAFDRLKDKEVGNGEFWCFGDWVPTWEHGNPPGGAKSTVHRLTMKLAEFASNVLMGKPQVDVLSEFSQKNGFVRSNLDPTDSVSEHAEALYRILRLMVGLPIEPWPTEALEKANADKCTYYFSYYKNLAKCASLPNAASQYDYLTEIGPWKEMIENGLSTFAENPEPVRSDCHAWSAHPALGFFQTIAGVTSIAPAWKKAQIAPHPGKLRRFDAHIAHPLGDLNVKFEDGKLSLDTPVPAVILWQGSQAEVKPGRHSF